MTCIDYRTAEDKMRTDLRELRSLRNKTFQVAPKRLNQQETLNEDKS